MVSASKMKRSQNQALQSRPYSEKLRSVMSSLVAGTETFRHPLTTTNESKKQLVLLISTNKSLCGSLNSNLFRTLLDWSQKTGKDNLSLITVGRKGAEMVAKTGFSLAADYSQIKERFDFIDTLPISHYLLETFLKKEVGQVWIAYSDFVSTLVQKPRFYQLLPIDPQAIRQELKVLNNDLNNETNQFQAREYLIEPNPRQILSWLLPYYVELQVYHYLLEGAASEHSARMVAMKNATDSAKEIVDDLTLTFNKLRQAQITAEISVVATSSLLSQNG